MEYNLQMYNEGCDLVSSIILNADLDGLKNIKTYSYEMAGKYFITKEKRFQFVLCVDEIFSNCIVHAYEKKGGDVEINFLVKDQYLITDIRDFGKGINIKEKDRYLSLNENLLMFSGRGLFLVNNLCDRLLIKRCKDYGTFVRFYFKMEG